jgi:hypothetical protein
VSFFFLPSLFFLSYVFLLVIDVMGKFRRFIISLGGLDRFWIFLGDVVLYDGTVCKILIGSIYYFCGISV